MSDIQYNFANNFSTLSDVSDGVNKIESAKNDVIDLFNRLEAAFDGTTAQQFRITGNQITSGLEELAHQMRQTTGNAVDQQNHMQALDARHASSLGG